MIRKIIIVTFALLSLFCTQTLAASAPAQVVIHSKGLIWGKDILLGSIADISCEDPQRYQDLVNMKLGFIGKPGGEKILTAYVLRLQIQSSGVDSSNISWSMPQSVEVTRASQTVSADKIIAAAKAEMKRVILQTGETRQWTAEILTAPSDMVIPPGQLTLKAEIPYGVKYAVPTVVYVYLQVKGQTVDKALCRLQMHLYDNVVVASKPLRANEILTAADLHIEKKEIGAINTDYLTKISDVTGKMSRYPLRPGDILKARLLVMPDIIKRGAPVKIIVKTKGLFVKASGIALMDGSKGEYIRVKNLSTGKIISGKVVDAQTVNVEISD
ncbi:flagellar basal body P-ring formation chaperone FlgA [Pectinatus sottacetonis]|uniref:flagellar basal body P-ring formation chaperone FlgA n=1 Tax=Pectinatus sottacetonis TaxID=1002795 RepID=UPI0018C62394|nr:flagellar basal body P-ring formation chaperone FlgA [Pectinatus sottacetonis]